MTGVVVAIDGPAGSGKSTIAAGLAARLDVTHVDTGAFYRAATLISARAGVAFGDEAAVLDAIADAMICRRGGTTFVDDVDVERAIRQSDINANVSTVAGHLGVRAHLVAMQRAAVPDAGAVVEGRDAGTVIVPDADLKVWLTADVTERAARRASQSGVTDATEIAAEAERLAARDQRDAANMVNAGHTVRAADDVEVDTTGLSIAEVVERVAQLALARAQVQR